MDLRTLLVGPTIRVKYVNRFSSCRTLHKESVAEHAYFTSIYCLVLAEWLKKEAGVSIDYRDLLLRSLIHDMEECVTGDIPRDFKHRSKVVKHYIEQCAQMCVAEIFHSLLHDEDQEAAWMEAWVNAKDNSLEGLTVTFADFLSVLAYLYEETRMARSLSIREHLTSLEDYFKIFTKPKFEMFRPLVDQARVILYEEILNGSK